MLQIIIDREQDNIQVQGRPEEIAGEIGFAIAIIHESCKAQSPEAAEQFRLAITVAVAPESPAWQNNGHVAETCICKPESRAATMDELNSLIKAGASPDVIARFLRGK